MSEYTAGESAGEKCVTKVLRSGPVFIESAFEYELAVVKQAADIIDKFNDAEILDDEVWLAEPQIWYWEDKSQGMNLDERFLENFQKFNSNTGWVSGGLCDWNDGMQALSHFSYHVSGGQFVLCDLQGAVYGDGVILSDIVLHSRDRRFGATDMGAEGIANFFHWHECNEYCCCGWTRPRKTHTYFPLRSGTSMMGRNGEWIQPTRQNCKHDDDDDGDYYDD
jgi:hypothetical protein